MIRTPANWSTVLSSFGSPKRLRRGPDGEQLWLGRLDWQCVNIRLPRTTAFLVLCPKSQPWDWCLADRTVPTDVAILCEPYPAEIRLLQVLKALSPKRSATIFLGDMDPYGIVQYLETRRMLAEAKGPQLLYGGVDDAWLDSMARTLRRRSRLDNLRIPLQKHEKALLRRLDRAVDLDRVVGPRSSTLLRSGFKLELEGATNPALYPSGHRRWIFAHLRSMATAWRWS